MRLADGLHIHPGQPGGSYDEPEVVVVQDHTGDVIETGRKVKLRGEWTLRQYRNPVPCGARFVLTPTPGATYEWESRD